MIARAERLGGTASVTSTIGEGSRMEAQVPLASELTDPTADGAAPRAWSDVDGPGTAPDPRSAGASDRVGSQSG